MGNPKVYRLHETGSRNIIGWGNGSVPVVDEIIDSNAATAVKEITSIPSPFARMALAKNAFRIVVEQGLDGKSAYHKIVSDCLDVGQIFFYIDKYVKDIEIIEWDRNRDLNDLVGSSEAGHRYLGDSYSVYLEQDAGAYNFNRMNSLYLLNYKGKGARGMLNILGATSPATVFFTPANDLSAIGKNIDFGNGDHPFDNFYMPLYKRDEEYVKWWWNLKSSMSTFATDFPEVEEYLQKSVKSLSSSTMQALRTLPENSYRDEYVPIVVSGQNEVKVLNTTLRKQVVKVQSGFAIRQSKKNEMVPLCLPCDTFTEQVQYVSGYWQKNYKAPEEDSKSLNDRTLPFDGTRYPYLTKGDFLEKKIIQIPYPLNSEYFFDGNYNNSRSDDPSYLIPLKRTFFDYFSVEDLMGQVDGKPMFEIKALTGGVKVTLRVPIVKQGVHVEYSQIYTEGKDIEKREFTLGVFPPIRYDSSVCPFYSIGVFDRDSAGGNKNNPYKLDFYSGDNQPESSDAVVRRNRMMNDSGQRIDAEQMDSSIYVLRKNFQYISLEDCELRAVIVPKFKNRSGNSDFTFAVDFGTTNTHVEYSKDGGVAKAFDMTDADSQLQLLHRSQDRLIKWAAMWTMVPTVGELPKYGDFPVRTALAVGKNVNWNRAVHTMGNVNIPFAYEKMPEQSYNNCVTNIKWASDDNIPKKYIENLVLLIRNKVLINGGNLKTTKLIWFYPASMTQSQLNGLAYTWKKFFEEYIGAPATNLISMSESVAPYYYYRTTQNAVSDIVSIDIGGGTTDVLVVEREQLKVLTSFRFAANSIFGDGYKQNLPLGKKNGFVEKYYKEITKLLNDNELSDLEQVHKENRESKRSEDIISFYFSLLENKDVCACKMEKNFASMLADDQRGKYVFVIFYIAIIWHIAQIMKAKGLRMPHHLTFSGNGSKILNVLTPNDETLCHLTKLIFEKEYGEKYSRNGLVLIRPGNAKELTCKGGIANPQPQTFEQVNSAKAVLLGLDDKTFSTDSKYDDIDEKDENKVIMNVMSFYNAFFELCDKFSMYDNFNIDSSILPKIKEKLYNDEANLRTYLQQGIKLRKEKSDKIGAPAIVEDSLFFYPLVGELNDLINFIYSL